LGEWLALALAEAGWTRCEECGLEPLVATAIAVPAITTSAAVLPMP
jgi:hypothetical protein